MIKRAWLTKLGRGAYMLSIREFSVSKDFPLLFDSYEFPPSEEIGGKKLDIDEARSLKMVEPHHQIGLLTDEDLIKLKEAINKVLGYE